MNIGINVPSNADLMGSSHNRSREVDRRGRSFLGVKQPTCTGGATGGAPVNWKVKTGALCQRQRSCQRRRTDIFLRRC